MVLPLTSGNIPEVVWQHGDDLCDCPIQRIGMWTNPYLAVTEHIRLCCLYARLAEDYPEFFETTHAFMDVETDTYVTDVPQEWNGEYDMPDYLWYRQLAREQDKPIEEIRQRYKGKESPRGIPKPGAPVRQPTAQLRANPGTVGTTTGITRTTRKADG